MGLKCSVCDQSSQEMSSKCTRQFFELNLQYAYALRSIGKDVASGKTFSGILNIVPPSTKFVKYNNKLLKAENEVCEAFLRNAVIEAREENEGNTDISAAFDGT